MSLLQKGIESHRHCGDSAQTICRHCVASMQAVCSHLMHVHDFARIISFVLGQPAPDQRLLACTRATGQRSVSANMARGQPASAAQRGRGRGKAQTKPKAGTASVALGTASPGPQDSGVLALAPFASPGGSSGSVGSSAHAASQLAPSPTLAPGSSVLQASAVSDVTPEVNTQASAASAEDAASGAAGSSGGNSCWFECGTTENLYNIGTTRYIKFTCGLCNSSRKSLESQARVSPAFKTHLEGMKKNKQGMYKAKVRAGRLVPGSAEGPSSFNERARMIAEYSQEVSIQASVADQGVILWPNEEEYVAYRKNNHNMTDPQARAAWTAAINNPDILKRGSGVNTRVPIAGIPRTVGSVARISSRRVNVFTAINNQDQLNIAAGRMNVGALPAPTSGEFNDVGGSMFRPAAASGVADGLQIVPPAGPAAALPSFAEMEAVRLSVGDPQDSGGAASSGLQAPQVASRRRTLRQTASEALDEGDPRHL